MKHKRTVRPLPSLFTFIVLLVGPPAFAELTDGTQVNQAGRLNAPGGVINKSLEQQVGAGHGDANTPGSAVYLVKRDPARSVRRGRQLFQRKFTEAQGQGPRVNRTSTGDITTNAALGAGLADSCAACHGRPRGSAGFGGDVVTRPDSRDAPHLFGLGLVEQLADEMTQELRGIRYAALGSAFNTQTCDATPSNAPPWAPNVSYSVGTRVSFAQKEFQVLQAHTSRAGWEPPNVPALWNRTLGAGVCAWDVQTPYPLNARVLFNNRVWQVRQAHTSQAAWDPVRAPTLWQVVTSSGTATRTLTAKNVNFGSLTVRNGAVETNNVRGVNPDLRVRPFFHQGGTVSMREFANGAFKDEMGLQSTDVVLCAVTDPGAPRAQVSPAGFLFDPTVDVFERPPTCDVGADPDSDGARNEIDTALVDHMEFYLLNYFKAGRYQVTQRANEGLGLMNQIGCTTCHVQNLTITRDRRVADLETAYDPARGIFNDLFATAATLFHVVPDGNPFPLILPNENPFVVQNFFSDLKRHDLGPNFHERNYDGTRQTLFVTEPLWGVGSSAPYGHDGRSINLNEVILRHGGEAQSARNGYASLSADNKSKVQEFLNTLILFPPDDTASSLNPGNPNTNDPQVPAQHGAIDLSVLFQIPSEGPE